MVGKINTSKTKWNIKTVIVYFGLLLPFLVNSQTQTLSGIVYEDVNKDGIFSEKVDKPLKGVSISNGIDIATSNSDGKYNIPLFNGSTVFVIKPKGYITKITKDNTSSGHFYHNTKELPKFNYPSVTTTDLGNTLNFALYPNANENNLKIALLGDTQVKIIDDIYYLSKVVAEQIIDEKVDFVVPLGDLVYDDLNLFKPLKKTLAKIGAPIYYVYGNHDRNYEALDFEHRDASFKKNFGPSYYAFEYGNHSFIVLNTVFPKTGTMKYEGKIDKNQLTFIQNYVKTKSPENQFHLFMHIPLEYVSNTKDLFSIFKNHPKVSAYAGHTHTQYFKDFISTDGWPHKQPMQELVAGAVCGSWWRGEKDSFGIPLAMMRDGTPKGYWIMNITDNQKTFNYKLSGNINNKQMHIYTPFDFKSEKFFSNQNAIYANVYAANNKTEVSLKIDEGEWVYMNKVDEVDPFFLRLLNLQEQKITPTVNGLSLGNTKLNSAHLWKYNIPNNLQPGTYTITIKANNNNGFKTSSKSILHIQETNKTQ